MGKLLRGKGFGCRGLTQQFQVGPDDLLGRHEPEAVVVPLGADALVAGAARDVAIQNAAGHRPRRVLEVGHRVQADYRGAARAGILARPVLLAISSGARSISADSPDRSS